MILRDDDVFLTESPTDGALFYDFEKFKYAHELIADAGFKHMLAICASEIPNHRELTGYILDRKEEFEFGIHGWGHEKYSTWENKTNIARSLFRAKERIENVFEVEVKWFFPPWNKRSQQMYDACEEIGLKLDDSWQNFDEYLADKCPEKETICFHYWNDHEVMLLKKALEKMK